MKSLQPVGRGVADGTLLSIINAYESTDWHDVSQHTVGDFSSKDDVKVMSSAKLLREGKELLNVLSRAYSRYTCANDSQKAWMRTAAKDVFLPLEKKSVATLTDSLDSMAVLASECCPLNYKFITSLFNMCQNSALRVMMSAVERMHAVFMEVLPNRKLRYIDQLDTSCVTFLSYHLSLWEKNGASTWDSLDPNARLVLHAVSFEDFFKGAYAAYIQLVKDQLEGGVFFVQRRMLQYVFEMLAKKPEQEGLLLDILVNTLFNGDSKLSSIASTKLNALLECHSGMKGVVVNRFGTLLLGLLSKVKCGFTVDKSKSTSKSKRRGIRSSVSPELIPTLQSVHRGLQFLSSIAFTRKDTKATAGAIKCYISVLSFIFATKPDTNTSRKSTPVYELEEFSRIIRCISSGLERCVTLLRNSESQFDLSDYISGDSVPGANLESTINSLYNAAGNPVSLKTNIALLSLLSKIHSSEPRFYNLLYDRILDLRIYEAENRRYFLSLVTRFITHADDISIIAAFVKRLLQVGLCLASTSVGTVIVRICRLAMSSKRDLHAMLNSSSDISGFGVKGKSTFQGADKSHLWEYYLQRLYYHPTVSEEIVLLPQASPDNMVDFEVPSLFEELGAASGQLSGEGFEYTQRAYWTGGRKALPHQLIFKLFNDYRSLYDTPPPARKASDYEEREILSGSEDEEHVGDDDSLYSDDESVYGDKDALAGPQIDSDGMDSDDGIDEVISDDDSDISDDSESLSDVEDDVASDTDQDLSDSDVSTGELSSGSSDIEDATSSSGVSTDSDTSYGLSEDVEPPRKAKYKPSKAIAKVEPSKGSKKHGPGKETSLKKQGQVNLAVTATSTKKSKVKPSEDSKGPTVPRSDKPGRAKPTPASSSDELIMDKTNTAGKVKGRKASGKSDATVATKSSRPGKEVKPGKKRDDKRKKHRHDPLSDMDSEGEPKRRKKISQLIEKATKGSFADISDIPGVEEFL